MAGSDEELERRQPAPEPEILYQTHRLIPGKVEDLPGPLQVLVDRGDFRPRAGVLRAMWDFYDHLHRWDKARKLIYGRWRDVVAAERYKIDIAMCGPRLVGAFLHYSSRYGLSAAGTYVHPKFRRRKIAMQLWDRAIKEHDAVHVATITIEGTSFVQSFKSQRPVLVKERSLVEDKPTRVVYR